MIYTFKLYNLFFKSLPKVPNHHFRDCILNFIVFLERISRDIEKIETISRKLKKSMRNI